MNVTYSFTINLNVTYSITINLKQHKYFNNLNTTQNYIKKQPCNTSIKVQNNSTLI